MTVEMALEDKQAGLSPRTYAATASTLSTASIVGIGVGGAVALLLVVVSVGVYLVRRNDQIQRAKAIEIEASFKTNEQLASILQSCRPRGTSMSDRSSYIPFLPPHQYQEPIELPLDTYEDGPPMARTNTKKISPHRVFSRLSVGLRDSWPMGALGTQMQIPNSLRSQSQSTVTLNQVAPPGYIISSDPKRPKRTYSRTSRNKVSVSSEDSPYTVEPSPSAGPYKPISRPRRANSENQLSTILRSTSQRLKEARRKSLSRTLTAVNRVPGGSGVHPLQTPTRHASESREVLVEPQPAASTYESFREKYIMRTPSPGKRVPRLAGQAQSKRKSIPSLSAESDDSLCIKDLPEVVLPSPLTSPSKRFEHFQSRNITRESTDLSKDAVSHSHKDDQTAVLPLGREDTNHNDFSPFGQYQNTVSNDPFYTSVPIRKPLPPTNPVDLSPRPLYIRKTTFGQETALQKSTNSTSPLKDISGNRQSPPKSGQPQTASTRLSQEVSSNPFQWSPKESTRRHSTSPSRSEARRKKGHKRSKVIRMSNLPRLSNVSIVPEEPDEDSSLFDASKSTKRVNQQSQSPSPRLDSSSQRFSIRPPSSPVFDPRVTVSQPMPEETTDSPTLGRNYFSPTLTTTNYYSEQTSEDEFFKSTRLIKRSTSTTRKWRESSISPNVSPVSKLHEMISFPMEDMEELSKNAKARALSPNSEIVRALEDRITPPMTPPNSSSPVLSAYSGFAAPIPGHLTGPRAQSPKRYTLHKPPTNKDLRSSIVALRRMNSEVSFSGSPNSLYSNPSNIYSEIETRRRTPGSSPSRTSNTKPPPNRASKHYLFLGASNSTKQQRTGNRDLNRRISRGRSPQQRQRLPKVDSEDDFSSMGISSTLASDKPPVGSVELEFPIQSNASMPNSRTNEEKGDLPEVASSMSTDSWTDSIPKPPLKSARRESQIQYLSAIDPSKRGWRRESKVAITDASKASDEGKENAKDINGDRSPPSSASGSDGKSSPVTLPRLRNDPMAWETTEKKAWGSRLNPALPTPDSPGLYDAQGFLRSSPDRDDLKSNVPKAIIHQR